MGSSNSKMVIFYIVLVSMGSIAYWDFSSDLPLKQVVPLVSCMAVTFLLYFLVQKPSKLFVFFSFLIAGVPAFLVAEIFGTTSWHFAASATMAVATASIFTWIWFSAPIRSLHSENENS